MLRLVIAALLEASVLMTPFETRMFPPSNEKAVIGPPIVISPLLASALPINEPALIDR